MAKFRPSNLETLYKLDHKLHQFTRIYSNLWKQGKRQSLKQNITEKVSMWMYTCYGLPEEWGKRYVEHVQGLKYCIHIMIQESEQHITWDEKKSFVQFNMQGRQKKAKNVQRVCPVQVNKKLWLIHFSKIQESEQITGKMRFTKLIWIRSQNPNSASSKVS